MSHRTRDSRHAIDSCTLHLHSWRPFQFQTLDSDPPNPYSTTKRPCLSDRTTSFALDSIDISKLSIIDDDKPIAKRGSLRLIARKRRRRGSRSVSGRSSDRSGTRRCCSVGASAAHGTCSDFPLAVGTDSSGELFGNGDANWSSDVSEAKNSKEREREEKDNLGLGLGRLGILRLKDSSLDMGVSRVIEGMLNLGMKMKLMKRRKMLGCSFGVTNLQV